MGSHRHRTRSRRGRTLRSRIAIVSIGLTAVLALVIAGIAAFSRPASGRYQVGDGLSRAEAALLEKALKASAESSRPNYPFSVIGGGVFNAAELGAAIKRDDVVAAHYKDVSLEDVRVERVTEPRFAYVSYRKGDEIYWTKNKVRLHPGETILTDGDTQIRARCGNCISLEPMLPTSPDEPESVQLEPCCRAASSR